MTSCGYTPGEIDEMTLHDVLGLFAYWRDFPPAHEILKCVYRIEQKQELPITTSKSDPSGIGGLSRGFPTGLCAWRMFGELLSIGGCRRRDPAPEV